VCYTVGAETTDTAGFFSAHAPSQPTFLGAKAPVTSNGPNKVRSCGLSNLGELVAGAFSCPPEGG